jgi:putative membrane protein insertion efficiency factor
MKHILIVLVLAYRYVISPLIGSSCRFQPTCSQYAIDALKTRGVFKACLLIMRRLTQCHPWGGSGSDPVP